MGQRIESLQPGGQTTPAHAFPQVLDLTPPLGARPLLFRTSRPSPEGVDAVPESVRALGERRSGQAQRA